MRKLLVVMLAALAGLTVLAAAPSTATPSEPNHGQCVSSSPKPDGKGGRSERAKDKDGCTPPPPSSATPKCHASGGQLVVVSSVTDTVTVTGSFAVPGGSSLECTLDIDLAQGSTVTFDYALTGDRCGGGVPRVFVTVDDTNYNNIDSAVDADPECDTNQVGRRITYTIPAGSVTHIGLVYDRGDTGSVTYSKVTVGGVALDF